MFNHNDIKMAFQIFGKPFFYIVKIAIRKPKTIITNFRKSNLWPSFVSKSIVVEICKNIPTANALIILVLPIMSVRLLEARYRPQGAEIEKIKRANKNIGFEMPLSSKIALKTIAIGIL